MSLLRVEGVSKSFGDDLILNNMSFAVEEGELFGVIGTNGCGKTTLLKTLVGFYKPDKGRVLYNDKPIEQCRSQIKREVGFTTQENSFYDRLTVEENITYFGSLYGLGGKTLKERTERVLALLDLLDARHKLADTLSGGMKRRLEIARGLLHHPKVLFLDEPTIGLDPQTRNHIWNYIRNLNQEEKVTIFFTTHHMEEVDRIAEQIAIIDHGKILIQGTPAEIKQKAGTDNLEDAFIALTGHEMRVESANFSKSTLSGFRGA